MIRDCYDLFMALDTSSEIFIQADRQKRPSWDLKSLFAKVKPRVPEDLHHLELLDDQVITDQRLIEHYYRYFKSKDVRSIATDRYIDKSRNVYNEAWLAREIAQNFVDHNPKDPGTLNGVDLVEDDIGKGTKRFTIKGNWPFEDITGVISPHSDKPEGVQTAGGNGIGLKQAAIRYLRDFGVKKFEIQGEGWVVNYQLAKADDINNEWGQQTNAKPIHTVKHDWLVAEMKQGKRSGSCSYIIETDNIGVID